MTEFIYKQMPYTTVRSLKNSLAMGWEDGKDVIFGMDRGRDIDYFDDKLYHAFKEANNRIEAGENADKVFFDFIYDGYEQPEQLYWKDTSYLWKPETEGGSALSGVGYFVLKTLWSIHPEYDLARDFEKDDKNSELTEMMSVFSELLKNKCLSAYMRGYSEIIADKGISAMKEAEQLFDKGEDVKSRDMARHEMIDNLYRAGYEMYGHSVLVTDFGTFAGMDELRSAMKQKIEQSVDSYVEAVRSLMQETFIDQRLYNWLVYTNQLDRFYQAYEIDPDRQEEQKTEEKAEK